MSEFILSPDEETLQEELRGMAGGSIPAVHLLELTALLDEIAVEEALNTMEQYKVALDVSALPPLECNGSIALRLKQEAQAKTLEMMTKGLDANDPLLLYLQELAQTPAAGDIQMYAERYLTGEHHLAEQMVNLCLSRVLEIAVEYTGHGVLFMDLIQDGSMGLWESISCYEGGDFMEHAQWWIRQAMAKSVFLMAHSSGVGQMLRESMEDYMDADQRLLVELGRNPTVEEIAEALHISPEECETLEKMVDSARKMEKTKQEQEEPELTPEDQQAVEDTAYFQVRQRIGELLATLSEEDAELLRLRFGLDDHKPMSPVQTGQLLGLTPEEVVRREAAALAKLRNE